MTSPPGKTCGVSCRSSSTSGTFRRTSATRVEFRVPSAALNANLRGWQSFACQTSGARIGARSGASQGDGHVRADGCLERDRRGFGCRDRCSDGKSRLIGFGLNAVVDSSASAVLVWRFRAEEFGYAERAERAERLALRLAGSRSW